MMKVHYTLSVGIDSKFSKTIAVEALPCIGSLLKAANHSFVVKGLEQDLDSYEDRDHEIDGYCNNIKAVVNDEVYRGHDYEKIRVDLVEAGWAHYKQRAR